MLYTTVVNTELLCCAASVICHYCLSLLSFLWHITGNLLCLNKSCA